MYMRREQERLSKINRAVRQTEEELDTLQELQDVTPELLAKDERELKEAQVLRDHYYSIGDIGSAQEEEDRIEALEEDIAFGEAAEPLLESEISDVESELEELKDVQQEMEASDDVSEEDSSVDVKDEVESSEAENDTSGVRGVMSNVAQASQVATGSRRLPSALEKIEKHAQNEREKEDASPLHRRSRYM